MMFSRSQCLFIILILVITCSSFANGAKKKKKKPPKDLEIITEYKPDDCSILAENGDSVKVHYIGTLESGSVFDSSRQENRQPIDFKLGGKMVIPGWELGIVGMCVGEKRKLIIPPHLGYGKKGTGPIPPDATLIFETELVGLDKPDSSLAHRIMKLVRFLIPPAIVVLLIYYIWEKSTKNPSGKHKGDKRGKKKK